MMEGIVITEVMMMGMMNLFFSNLMPKREIVPHNITVY